MVVTIETISVDEEADLALGIRARIKTTTGREDILVDRLLANPVAAVEAVEEAAVGQEDAIVVVASNIFLVPTRSRLQNGLVSRSRPASRDPGLVRKKGQKYE